MLGGALVAAAAGSRAHARALSRCVFVADVAAGLGPRGVAIARHAAQRVFLGEIVEGVGTLGAGPAGCVSLDAWNDKNIGVHAAISTRQTGALSRNTSCDAPGGLHDAGKFN